MLSGIHWELIVKLNELFEFAKRGDDDFPDEVSNFITEILQLEAAVIFNINSDRSIVVLGRTSGAKRNFSKSNSFSCDSCRLIDESVNYTQYHDTNCSLQICEFLVYEACSLLIISQSSKFLIKFAKKTPFTKTDKEYIDNILQLLSPFIIIWSYNRSGDMSLASSSFPQYVGDMAFELRNNANAIVGNTSIFVDGAQSNVNNEFVSNVKLNTQNILTNVNDLAELAKIESKKIVEYLKKVYLSSVIEDTFAQIKEKIDSSKVEFSYSIDEALKTPIYIDESKLKYILTNLLSISVNLTGVGKISVNANVFGHNNSFGGLSAIGVQHSAFGC